MQNQASAVLPGVEAMLGGLRDAISSEYVNRSMTFSRDPKIISAQSIQSSVQEYLETDGPATCLVFF